MRRLNMLPKKTVVTNRGRLHLAQLSQEYFS
jgi:hypothetical protein